MKFDVSDLLSGRYLEWGMMLASLIFAFLILFDVYLLFFSHSSAQLYSSVSKEPSIRQSIKKTETLIDTSLFGIYVPVDMNASEVKQSMLNVELAGIIFREEVEQSQAIIRTAGGKEQAYHLGQTISGGAVIKRILSDSVLVEYHGTLERILLPKHHIIFQPAPSPLIKE